MNDSDRGKFNMAFKHLYALLARDRPAARDFLQVEESYFKLLEEHDIDQVIAAGKTLAKSSERFPTPATWIATIAAARQPVSSGRPVGIRELTEREAREYQAAKLVAGRGDPCCCSACQSAGVGGAGREPRFVPIERGDGEIEQAFDPISKKVIPVCAWAHGQTLRHWYEAVASLPAEIEKRTEARRAIAESCRMTLEQAIERHDVGDEQRRRAQQRLNAIDQQLAAREAEEKSQAIEAERRFARAEAPVTAKPKRARRRPTIGAKTTPAAATLPQPARVQ